MGDVGVRVFEEGSRRRFGRFMTTAPLTIILLVLAAMLRDPIPSSWDSGEAPLGLPEALLIIGIVILLLLLAGWVIWKVRRSPRNHSK